MNNNKNKLNNKKILATTKFYQDRVWKKKFCPPYKVSCSSVNILTIESVVG